MIKKIIYNSGAQVITKGAGLLISLLATALLTRKLGTYQYGQYALIISFINMLVAVGNWGTQIIGVRELSRAKNKAKTFASISRFRSILGLIASILALIIVLFVPVFRDIKLLALFSVPLILGLITETTFEIIFQSFIRMDVKTIISIISSIVFLISTASLLYFGFGLLAPILSWILKEMLIVALSSIKSKSFIKEKAKPDLKIIKHLIKESLPMGALLVVFSAYDQAIDSFVIKHFLGATQVGLYGLAYKIYSNLVLPAYFLSNTIFPIIAKAGERKSKKALKIGLGLTIIGLLPLIPLILVASRFIIILIAGQSFVNSVLILRILSLSLIFSYINHLTGFSLVAFNRQTDSLKIGIFALIWNLALNLIFVPQGGIIAAAWITVSTEALVTFVSSFALAKRYRTREKGRSII